MHRLFIALTTISCLLFNSGCERDIDISNMRQEVLFHFENQEDSFKLASAHFLLDHLEEQKFLSNPKAQAIIVMLTDSASASCPRRRDLVDSVHTAWKKAGQNKTYAVHYDVEQMTSAGLTHNIELAVNQWKSTRWANDYSFEQFCNYVLPHKSGDGPPQEEWREFYLQQFDWIQDTLQKAENPNDLIRIVLDSTQGTFCYISNLWSRNTFGPMDNWRTHAGNCVQHAHFRVNILHSLGIPAVYLYAPQWANHNEGHAWFGVVNPDGSIKSHTVDPMLRSTRSAKLFTSEYTTCPTSFMSVSGYESPEDVPEHLQNPNMRDITREMIPVSNINVDLTATGFSGQKYAFLSIFSIRGWNPIDWTEIQDNRAEFHDLGLMTAYLPSYYEKGEVKPASDVVILELDGNAHAVPMDTSEWVEARLTAKYPLQNSMYHYCKQMNGALIQGATDTTFADTFSIYKIPHEPGRLIKMFPEKRDRVFYYEYWDSVTLDRPVSAEAVRLLPPPVWDCFVGELEFYDSDGQLIGGRAIGSGAHPEWIHDGMYGEAYRDTSSTGWVGYDFGRKVAISKIKWLPSNDSNSIQTGDEYELFCWTGKEWTSLGKQVAESPVLTYKIPVSGLLWLRCLSRGVEERPFIYDQTSGLQMFY